MNERPTLSEVLVLSTSAIASQASTPRLFPPRCTSSTPSSSFSSPKNGSSSAAVFALRFLPRIDQTLAEGAVVDADMVYEMGMRVYARGMREAIKVKGTVSKK